MSEEKLPFPKLNNDEFIAMLKHQRDMCYSNMEGQNLPEFLRWESLFCAYDLILRDFLKEIKGGYKVEDIEL